MHGRLLIVFGRKGFILYSEIQFKGGLPKRGGGGVHWVTEGGFLVPKTAGGESFKEILGQQKCQGWSRLQITFSQNGYYANLKENNMTE